LVNPFVSCSSFSLLDSEKVNGNATDKGVTSAMELFTKGNNKKALSDREKGNFHG